MNGAADRGRLAVRTYVDGGDEVAFGEPVMTDAERAAARCRAGERWAAGVAPDDDEPVLGVWCARDPRALRARVADDGDNRLAVWAEDDVLHVIWASGPSRSRLAELTGDGQTILAALHAREHGFLAGLGEGTFTDGQVRACTTVLTELLAIFRSLPGSGQR